MGLSFELLGWPPDGPTLRLDYRRFSYAGKFVVSSTGKAVVRDPDADADSDADAAPEADEVPERGPAPDLDLADVVGAAAFSADRTDPDALRIRYVTARADRRGEGVGPPLAAFVAARAAERGYERVRIAVNNPFAYQALYKAGFEYVGEETGIAELVLERPAGMASEDRDPAAYRAGLDVFGERDLSAAEESFCRRKGGAGLPPVVDPPEGDRDDGET